MSFLKSSSSISEAKSTLGLALVLATVLVVLVVGLFESNIKATAESQTFTALEETVGHLRKMHGVIRQDARNMSIMKIS